MADRRSYVWTYEYLTMPKGMAEVEFYLTHKISDWDNYDDKNSWEEAVEVEYGLTDHWDIAVYQTWQQNNSDTRDWSGYTGSKIRTRYRIGEKGQFPVDMLLYAEYILGDETEHGYATGLSYEFSPTWKTGIESTGNYTENKYYLGPTVSWASEKYWVNFGVLGGLNNRSDDVQFRLLVGIPF